MVPGDEEEGTFPGLPVHPQPLQGPVRQGEARPVVAVKVACAALVQGKSGRLAHVVEEGGQPEGGGGGDPFQRPDAVGVHIIEVVEIALVEAHRRPQLREDLDGHLREVQQHPPRPGGADEPEKFFPDALPGHMGQLRQVPPDGGRSLFL